MMDFSSTDLSATDFKHPSTPDGEPSMRRTGRRLTWPMVMALLSTNFLYACTGVFCKMASLQVPGTFAYWLCVGGALGILGTYAMLWQQIIAKVPISSAYMFRGTALIFALLLAAFLWEEPITSNNLAGAALLVVGITLYVQP